MTAEYDSEIGLHYDRMAEEYGLSPQSTMADDIIRSAETAMVRAVVESVARPRQAEQAGAGQRAATDNFPLIVDAGCGNGYTLKTLASEFDTCSYIGIEFNGKLRELAKQQVSGMAHVRVMPGDLRVRASLDVADGQADVLLCQRVLINLLAERDARTALDNLVSLVRPGGKLLFIESFASGLAHLNDARAEFGLEPLGPAHHNRYLEDDFFTAHPKLTRHALPGGKVQCNLLSTHYYVTRVLHSALTEARKSEFKRNSHFVKFLSAALPPAVGDYAPLQFHLFVKKAASDTRGSGRARGAE